MEPPYRESMTGDWRDRARCVGRDPELFFPVGDKDEAAKNTINKAKAVCIRCPVVEKCLSYALETRQDSGIWGGKTENERDTLKKDRAKMKRRANLARQAMKNNS